MSEPKLIYADQDIIVLNKPAGMPVHEAKHSTDQTLTAWLLKHFPEIEDVGDFPRAAYQKDGLAYGQPYRPGIVHRLDKQTSGVMVVARNQSSFLRLKELFKERKVEKVYTALVCGVIKERRGILKNILGRIKTSPTKIGIQQETTRKPQKLVRMPKEAITEYVVLKRFSSATLLEVYPKTGRMHQIRVQFAFLGHPIAGDTVYGGKRVCFRELGRHFLHSSSLSFSFHEGQVLSFSAELPEELKRILDALSGY